MRDGTSKIGVTPPSAPTSAATVQPAQVTIPSLPCDRGIPHNVLSRGYHQFTSSPDGAIYCMWCGSGPIVQAAS